MSRGKASTRSTKPVAKPIKASNIFEVLNDLPEEVPAEQPPVAAPLTWADLQTKYGSPSSSWADEEDEDH